MTSSSTREPAMVDVARLAGVSHQTVSRVLNNHPNVRVETARRVARGDRRARLPAEPGRAGAGHRAQPAARRRRAEHHPLRARVPAHRLRAGGGGGGVRGQRGQRRQPGPRGRSATVVERHLDQRVAGIVAIAPVGVGGRGPRRPRPGRPAGHRRRRPRPRPAAGVTVDQADGARLATQHLLDAGHRTVWHVTGPAGVVRQRGPRGGAGRRRCATAGAEVPPVLPADWSAASGYRVGQMLARIPEVTAVFAANDHLALGLLRALHERGLQVPRRHQHRRLRRRARGRALHPAAHHDPPRLPRRRRERPRPAAGADRLGGALDGAACPRPDAGRARQRGTAPRLIRSRPIPGAECDRSHAAG